jgi:lipoate---protein ligase
MQQNIWRLIPLMSASGQMQMAIDSWLLTEHKNKKIPPVLRFYTWSPPAISLGYHQHNYPEFWQNLSYNNQPIDIIKRPSGGRAVLHQGDLTYMIVTSDFQGSRIKVYKQLCDFLIMGWEKLGIDLYYGESQRGYIHNPNCFATATDADLITQEGVKLIGSAQLKRGEAILQHGSMRLFPDQMLFKQVFDEQINILDLVTDKNRDEMILEIIDSLVNAAKICFNMEIIVQPLSPDEINDIAFSSIMRYTRNQVSQKLPGFYKRSTVLHNE